MGYLQEYIDKKWVNDQYITELMKLISEYNSKNDTFMVVYATDTDKDVPPINKMLNMRDYQVLFDMLGSDKKPKLHFYLETPGGQGEAAEEIVLLTRRNFDHVTFVIAGEAKSAGTLMALSGNEIDMTDSGSLGPIDAQMQIGRSQISAHDYMQWINDKQDEYKKSSQLNPMDAVMIAQISPGELNGVENALNYAHDLVKNWLPQYKFANWDKTETSGKTVTKKMKEERAEEIAKQLSNHSLWRTHGRSLKIKDLQEIGLKINCIDDSKDNSEIVYRIHAVVRMIFLTSPIFKMFVTADSKLFESATPALQNNFPSPSQAKQDVQVVELNIGCGKCGKQYGFYVLFENNPELEKELVKKGVAKLPSEDVFTCDKCKNVIELVSLKKQLEQQTGKRVL